MRLYCLPTGNGQKITGHSAKMFPYYGATAFALEVTTDFARFLKKITTGHLSRPLLLDFPVCGRSVGEFLVFTRGIDEFDGALLFPFEFVVIVDEQSAGIQHVNAAVADFAESGPAPGPQFREPVVSVE